MEKINLKVLKNKRIVSNLSANKSTFRGESSSTFFNQETKMFRTASKIFTNQFIRYLRTREIGE